MAAAVPTTFTDQVVKTDEVAEFSPEIIAEMKRTSREIPGRTQAFGSDPDPAARHPARTRMGRQSGRQFSGEISESRSDRRLGDGDVLLDVQPASRRPPPHPDLQDALVQDHGRAGDNRHICRKLGIHPGETTADGKFTVSLVECLGSCGTAPMMQIGFDYHEDLTTEKVDKILEDCK